MAHHAHTWVVGQHSFDALRHFLGTIGADDLAGMLGVANAHAAAVVYGNPRGSAGCVHKRIQQRPVGDGIGAILHGFRLAIGRGDGATVEMIATDDDGSLKFTLCDQMIQREAELVALSVAEPADARG